MANMKASLIQLFFLAVENHVSPFCVSLSNSVGLFNEVYYVYTECKPVSNGLHTGMYGRGGYILRVGLSNAGASRIWWGQLY